MRKPTAELLGALQRAELSWIQTRKDACLFEAIFEGEHIQIRLNDFPDEPILTVIIRDEEIDLEETPRKWRLITSD